MRMKAIAIIDCRDAREFYVQDAAIFPATAEGEQAARQCFIDWVTDGQDPNWPLTNEEIENALLDGKFDIGDGFIAWVESR